MNRLGWMAVGGLGVTAVGCAVVLPVVMSVATMFGGTDLKKGITPVACGSTVTIQQVSASATPKVAGFSAAQVRNAAAIVAAGQDAKIPPRGWVIAVATAMQESRLKIYANDNDRWPRVKQVSTALPHQDVGHDHDSVGLFQQRPNEGELGSHGWGPVKDLMNPRISAEKFYKALKRVDGWQSMPLTDAAQRVQRSGYPHAYAKHENAAARLVDAVSGNAARTPSSAGTVGACAAHTDQVASSGWVRPVSASVGSGWRTASRPTHQGVDLRASRGQPIVAAAAGTVIHMECDRQREDGYNCNRDGSPSTGGCGWYLDIRHADGIITRYCHMLRKPLVGTGDRVKAGQRIGIVGTSGHSFGPHLHFEVHKGSRDSSSTVDPVKFMRAHGAPLGTKQKDGGADT